MKTNRNSRRAAAVLMTLVLSLTMVFGTAATSFAAETVTPTPVTYPVKADVVFLSEGGEVTDVSGVKHQTTAVEKYESVTFTSPFTQVFTGPKFLNDTTVNFPLKGVPTVMDAICQAYEQTGTTDTITLGWDAQPESGPAGAYVTTLFNNSTITTVSGLYRWEGYSWSIYLGDTKDWDETAGEGKIPYYASNVQLHDGDRIYVVYEENEETW